MKEMAINWILSSTKSITPANWYKKIVVLEWFAVAGLTSWLLLIFSTILN